MNIDTGNLFDATPETIDQEILTDLVQSKNVAIKRIVSKGQVSPESGWYEQDDNEWVVVLKGEAKVTFENGNVFHMRAGNYINIPAHAKHRVSWTSPDTETLWLAVHYT